MAHVLLPCDLPNWGDIQRNLAQMKMVKDTDQFIQGMTKLYDICSISLEPEDIRGKRESSPPHFEELRKFLEEVLSPENRSKFFNETLPGLVSQALCLRLAKPQNGFLYSLKREECSFELDRAFVKSLLANAFFSTFPKRTPKTHPCLQNFSFCDFFQHLHRRSQQKKLKAFLRYFQRTDDRRKTIVRFSRKVLSGKSQPALPGWLCSDKPLVPLIVRQDGNIHDAEPNISRAFTCSSLVGGDVLQAATSPESSLFYAFPELLCCLIFVEELEDNEALVVQNVIPYGIHKSRQVLAQEVNICLMDCCQFGFETDCQFEDRSLLRDLNKALVTFCQSPTDQEAELKQRRHTPVGESSSSGHPSASSSRRTSSQAEEEPGTFSTISPVDRKDLKKSSYFPLISNGNRPSDVQRNVKNITPSSSWAGEFPKIPGSIPPLATTKHSESPRGSMTSSQSSTRSLKTASESSLELPPITRTVAHLQKTGEDEYYTADEDSDEFSELGMKKKRHRNSCSRRKEADLSSLVLSTSALVGEKPCRASQPRDKKQALESRDSTASSAAGDLSRTTSSKRSESAGFVLGGMGSEDDIPDFEDMDESGGRAPLVHERLEDFRKRIRRRTRRHLSRKMRNSSRSSYSLGSSTSSDMEDISEEEDMEDSFQLHHHFIRTSNSEPSLASIADDVVDIPPFVLGSDTVVLTLSGRKVVVTSSNGHLKAYSYDGVNPNLPVPFKAKFRTRRARRPSEEANGVGHRPYAQEPCLGVEKISSFTDSEEELSGRASSSRLSSFGSFMRKTQDSEYEDEIVYRNKGGGPKNPVAVGPSKHGDAQLRALILWLAASMAGLPSLIFYTGHEFQLYELSTVYRKVLARQWTVGDLSCELLRFCRNRLSPRRNSCSSSLFEQLLSPGPVTLSTSLTYSQHSLD